MSQFLGPGRVYPFVELRFSRQLLKLRTNEVQAAMAEVRKAADAMGLGIIYDEDHSTREMVMIVRQPVDMTRYVIAVENEANRSKDKGGDEEPFYFEATCEECGYVGDATECQWCGQFFCQRHMAEHDQDKCGEAASTFPNEAET